MAVLGSCKTCGRNVSNESAECTECGQIFPFKGNLDDRWVRNKLLWPTLHEGKTENTF
jgi:uncharacterized membrane protein YvbJ